MPLQWRRKTGQVLGGQVADERRSAFEVWGGSALTQQIGAPWEDAQGEVDD